MSRATEGAVDQAILLATGIRNVRASINPQGDNDVLFATMIPNATRSISVPATDTCPGYYFLRNDTDGVLLVDGTSTLAQLRGIVAGYIGGLLDSRTEPVNQFFMNAGRELINGIVSRGTQFPAGMTLAGHSLGGPVASHALLSANRDVGWRVNSFTHTFGAPRPGGPLIRQRIEAQGETIRWMNDDDAVPIVPPRVENFPGILPAVGIAGCVRFANFVHQAGGIDIQLAGTLTDSVLPTHSQGQFTADLVAWLQSWVNDVVPSHSISEYLRRLQAAKVVLTPHARPALSNAEQPVGAAPQQINAQERKVVQAFALLERDQNAAQLVIPPEMLFQAIRAGRIWTVQYAGSTVGIGGSKRQARAMARVGNAMLRKMQRLAVVDASAVTQAFQRYMDEARSDLGGFSPVMNTDFPPGE